MSFKQQFTSFSIHASSGHSKGPEGAVCDLSVIHLINCFN